jgi:hypothetical protein
MEEIKIGDKLYHPMSIDIIEHKVISIRKFEDFNQYVLKATNNVGACGRVEVIVDEHKGNLRFVELVDEDDIQYSSGLQDFVEGNYYRTLEEAKIVHYEIQRTLAWSNMDNKERLYKEAKVRYEQVDKLVKDLKELIKHKTT